MELGSWAIIKEPSLLALIPLIVCVALTFMGRKNAAAIAVGCLIGIVLTGQGFAAMSAELKATLGTSTTLIGVIIMFGTGLGHLMNHTGVSRTMVYWIVKRIGVNSRTRAKIALIVCSILVCGMLGTLGGGNAVIAPVIVPIMAAVGVTPTVTATLFRIAGEIGLIAGPLTGVTLITMEVTGLSYGELMVGAVIPFAAVYLIGAWVGCNRAQKVTEGKEFYKLEADATNFDSIQITPKETRTTIIFLVSFVALVAIGIIFKLGTNYAITVILTLIIILTIASWTDMDTATTVVTKGMATQAGMFSIFILIQVLMDLVEVGGGFEALADLLGRFSGDSPTAVFLIASIVGGFGIEAAAVAEIKIIAEMFGPAAVAAGLPMTMFAMSILGATRLTAGMYPTGNMIGQMGLAHCENAKEVIRTSWIAVAFVWVLLIVWGFAGVAILT